MNRAMNRLDYRWIAFFSTCNVSLCGPVVWTVLSLLSNSSSPPSMGRAPSTVPMGPCTNAVIIMGGTPPIIYNLVIMGSIRSRGNNPISVRDCSTTCCDVHFNAICSYFSSFMPIYPGQGSQGFHLSITIQFISFSFSVPFWPLALGFIFNLTQVIRDDAMLVVNQFLSN